MVITVTEEKAGDYEVAARLATEAFGSSEVSLSANRMKWLYERAFRRRTAARMLKLLHWLQVGAGVALLAEALQAEIRRLPQIPRKRSGYARSENEGFRSPDLIGTMPP